MTYETINITTFHVLHVKVNREREKEREVVTMIESVASRSQSPSGAPSFLLANNKFGTPLDRHPSPDVDVGVGVGVGRERWKERYINVI